MAEEQLEFKKFLPTLLLSVSDAAYIAGIIDGEGNLSLSLTMPKRGGYHFGIRVTVTNTNMDLMNFLVKRVGGTIAKKPSYQGKLECYRWQICEKRKIRQFLKLILPYLIIKRQSAEIILEFLENFVLVHRYASDDIRKKEIERRTRLWEKIKVYQTR